MSKFSLEVLNRCVYPYFTSDDPDVMLGAVFGEDVALTRVGEAILVSHVDPIVGAVQEIGWLAVHVACNDIATSGAPPRWILPLVLVPSADDEALLKQIMQDIARAATEIGVSIIGGHTGYSANLARPLVAVTALGTLFEQPPILTQGAREGDHILVTKGIALEGTGILASDFRQAAFHLGLTDEDIRAAQALMKGISVIPEALLLARCGATAMHDVTRGGLLETLLEVASLSKVGMRVQFDHIPIPAVVSRFSDAFGFDPLKMISSGTLVATVAPDRLQEAQQTLAKNKVPCADIGQIFTGEGVMIVTEDEVFHHIDIHPEEDELARMWREFGPG